MTILWNKRVCILHPGQMCESETHEKQQDYPVQGQDVPWRAPCRGCPARAATEGVDQVGGDNRGCYHLPPRHVSDGLQRQEAKSQEDEQVRERWTLAPPCESQGREDDHRGNAHEKHREGVAPRRCP